MAIDIQDVCATAAQHQSSQDLAIWLSVLFSIYTFVAIALSALTIYTSSQMGAAKAQRPPGATGPRVQETSIVGYAGDGGIDGVSLVGLR